MNETIIYSAIFILLISNVIFAVLYFREIRKKSKTPKDSFEVNALLEDLLRGEAVIKCTRIVPNDIFLRSPRHGRV